MSYKLNQLTAISPIDGRYFGQVDFLSDYFSEYALIKTRAEIELKYLLFLSSQKISKKYSKKEISKIRKAYESFSLADAQKVKGFEEKTRHDVKALEYFLRSLFKGTSISKSLNWLHFGLTSNDINDNAYRLIVNRVLNSHIIPEIEKLTGMLKKFSDSYSGLPMLARTHGQPAVPTTFGKEVAVFYQRLQKELKTLKNSKLYGKFGGAVGNWNALALAYPAINWPRFSTKFLHSLGLEINKVTTQTAPADDLVNIFQNLIHINMILIGLNQDFWRYISDNWIVQKGKEGFTGSSTMPQKINPIEFENSEGNLYIANGLLETFSRKLTVSRLQRDLSDSTVFRNIGVSFAHCLIAYKSCIKGLLTITPNKAKILNDLNEDWSILTEALQTLLRKTGKIDAYEKIASKVRGKKLTQKEWTIIVSKAALGQNDKKILYNLTPSNYLGYAPKIRP